MKIIKGDIWKFHEQGEWICITTNGFVKANGCAVMGAGTAKQCLKRYPASAMLLGESIKKRGNIPISFLGAKKIIAFPVKYSWWEEADLKLIESSAKTLAVAITIAGINKLYLPKPGCGNGGLDWKTVKKVIAPILDDRFIVVDYESV